MTRKYATAPIHVPDTMPVDPTCACRFVRCDKGSSYCEVSRLAERAVVSSKAEGAPGLSESDALLQAFDKMAAFHRSEAAKRAGVPATGVSAVVQPPVVATRRKRRTKAEMAEFRAVTQSRIDAAAKAVTPDWLLEEDPMVQAILETPHDDS